MAGREVELISDRDLARKRLPIWAGSDMRQTIVMKELIDNEIDVVNERSQPASKTIIKISPHRLQTMDNGTGISHSIKEGTEYTNLWLACAKMFSSSNYDGVSESVGANGVGMTIANFTSKHFLIADLEKKKAFGYDFQDGFLQKNFVDEPLDVNDAIKEFDAPMDYGFLVDATWYDTPNDLFDDQADLSWLVRYAQKRTGEIVRGEVEMFVYEDDQFTQLLEHHLWSKKPGHENYIPSWLEQVKENKGLILREGSWQIAFFDHPCTIESIVQGAPVKSRYTTGCSIQIQDMVVRFDVPISFKYLSEDYPPYQDQTKISVRFPYTVVGRLFEKTGTIYRHYYQEAEKAYMAKVIKDSDSNMFWPSLGAPEDSELIIAEGYSAVSGLKSQRDPKTQACIALKGKILNCWNLEMTKAMRSDVVKQILNAVIYSNYKRVLIAVDADEDGNHIASLLISLFARFTSLIKDGKLYYIHTPHYLFKRRGSEILWSDKAGDCPDGYKTTTLKGLGGMSADEVRLFIMDDSTRDLVKIEWDDESFEALDNAFSYGGEHWIQ